MNEESIDPSRRTSGFRSSNCSQASTSISRYHMREALAESWADADGVAEIAKEEEELS